MATYLVFTFIGNDKPGLVERISETVASSGGNWLESRMTQLAGKFAGIIRVSIAHEQADQLTQSLKALQSQGLTVVIERSDTHSGAQAAKRFSLNIVGLDRPGIVKEVSHALSIRNINVIDMTSGLTSAAMSAEALFQADAIIEVPEEVDLLDLEEQLDDIANDLTIDITLEERVA